MKVVVIGGTGLIGSKVVEQLKAQGHDAVAASPRTGVNTLTGEGVAEVLAGASVVVDVSNSPSFEDGPVMDFFTRSTGTLLREEAAAGVGHHVALSVVGTDRLSSSGYFRAKLAQEKLIQGSPIPYSIVRATQFFEFLGAIAASSVQGESLYVPPALIQPIAAEDVANAVAAVAAGSPLNRIIDIAGPKAFRFEEIVRLVQAANGDTRQVITDPGARYFDADLEERSLVPLGQAQLGAIRYENWLGLVTA